MSAQAVAYATKYSPYTGAKFAIHFMIADVVNDTNNNEFWMSNENLARKARTSRQTVHAALGQMCEDGFLKLVERANQHKPATYRFLFPSVPVAYQPDVKPVDTYEDSDVVSLDTDVSSVDTDVSSVDTNSNNSIELKEHMINEVDQTNLFNDFWGQYPRKVGKQKAEKAFNKLDAATQQDALEGIARYAQFWEQQQTVLEYIPHPTTWINAARWEDELTEPSASTSDIRQYDQPSRPQCDICDSTGYITVEDEQHRSWAHPCIQCTPTP